ncbi:7798_t:CDS:1, partial [Racocetra persica]
SESELETPRGKIKEKNSDLTLLRTSLTNTNELLTRTQKERDDFKFSLEKENREKEVLKTELANIKQELAEAIQRENEKDQRIDELENSQVSLNQQIANLQEQVNNLRTNAEVNSQSLESMREQLQQRQENET